MRIHDLADPDVHVWSVDLDAPLEHAGCGVSSLSTAERQQANRFCFERDRRRYTAAHVSLRDILASYLDDDPAALELMPGHNGKPQLRGRNVARLRFNLTHSHGLSLVAVARRREVGIDVEKVRPIADALEIAERFFALRECASLQQAEDTSRAFLRGWTRKEAYVKAIGDGLHRGLDQFAVSLDSADARLLWVGWDSAEVERWSLLELAVPVPGFIAALAVEGWPARVEYRVWGDAASWPVGREKLNAQHV